ESPRSKGTWGCSPGLGLSRRLHRLGPVRRLGIQGAFDPAGKLEPAEGLGGALWDLDAFRLTALDGPVAVLEAKGLRRCGEHGGGHDPRLVSKFASRGRHGLA